ncbi:MAG TPA: DUF362 domain-containing protein [Bacteroidales bacterium]|nr:DUF362 domain-containing protein [Bacteroidales bacterium]
MQLRKFDISSLKGKLAKIRDWMTNHSLPPKLVFILMGIISTIWFLIRVIPKPSRASYPCMRVAAPMMSGFVLYLLAIAGITAASRKSGRKIFNVRYWSTALLLTGVVIAMAIAPSNNIETIVEDADTYAGPADSPNSPIGEARGIYPGRVVWVWNPDATNEKFEHNDVDAYQYFPFPDNNNSEVIAKMFRDGVLKLTGKKSPDKAWDAIFRYYNKNKSNKDKGYTKGEKIFIKINQGQAGWLLTRDDKAKGNVVPRTLAPNDGKRKNLLPTETGPYAILEMLRELVNDYKVDQNDIYIGDPMNPIYAHNYDVWVKEFPQVHYIDKTTTNFGRTQVKFTEKTLVYYSDKKITDKLMDIHEDATYMITSAVLKPHGAAGISLTAKSNFGNVGRSGAHHLHYSHLATQREGSPNNIGYKKYRCLVDLMGSQYLGQKNVFLFVEGLFGGGSDEVKGPVKYFMPPFNNDWCNSLFMSLDQVAIESVGFDFLRTEWNGKRTHDQVNAAWEAISSIRGVDDYIHQAADSKNWPDGITYDPDGSGKPIPSLGVHEHWNNENDKQYSRNLGNGKGIELVSIPANLVKGGK